MRKTRTAGRNKAAATRLPKFVACLILYAAICTPAAGLKAESTVIAGPQGGPLVPRRVSHLKVDTTFNSTGFRTDRFARSNDSVAGAIMQPDGKVILGVQTSSWWNSSWPFSYSGFEIIRLNADGSKDPTFGDECKREPNTANSWPLIAVLPDGKIITTGVTSNVMRCNPDGTVDTSFGVNGLRPTNFGFSGFAPTTLLVQPDGKIVTGGLSGSNFRLARLNDDGSPDTTFGTDGIALADFPSPGLASVLVQADGKIIAAGSSAGDFAVARFNPDGTLDTTFDGDGKLTTPIFSGNEAANSVSVQPDGKILAAGFSLNSPLSTSGVFALVRYNPDGSLDTTFDGDGKAATPVINTGVVLLASSISSVAVGSDGKITATGRTHNGLNYDHVTARYNADGSLDTSFGAGGFVVPPIPSINNHIEESPRQVFLRPDGRIFVAGDTQNWRGSRDVTIWQLNTDGSSDNSFGSAGRAEFDLAGQRTYATGVVVQPDGRILVAGRMSTGTINGQETSVIARYNVDGTRDTTFGGNGFVLQNEPIDKLAVAPDGKIGAGGRVGGSPSTAAFLRYNIDGSLDTSFDNDGKVTVSISSSQALTSMEFQPDGKLVFLNSSTITRLAADGALDNTFDGDGRASLTIGPVAVKIQSDGKIVAGGRSGNDFAVARLNTDGSVDTTFDGDGIATTDISGEDTLFTIALQQDGKIVAAGRYGSGGSPTAFVRYNQNGSLDTSFGNNGKTQFANASTFQALNIQPDGKILATGSGHLVRLNTDGLADTTFYGDGFTTFRNTKFRNDPAPITFEYSFDAQGRLIHVGTDRSTSGGNDNKSLFIGRVEILDHPYVHFDHNGDGKADLAVFRPSNSTWYVLTPDRFTATQLGQAGDKPVPADYDGDGITDLAVYRVGNGLWTMLNSETQTQSTRSMFGTPAMPLPADRDGDGYDDVSIAGNGLSNQLVTVMAFTESNSLFQQFFGVHGDIGVRGDFDGNGRADVAVFRPSNQTWYILSNSYSQGFYAVQWGAAGDIHVPADYDGDGATDIAVWRPSTGKWWILGSTAGPMNWTTWGEPADKPVPADYDGDGKTDIAVWRPSTGTWYIINSADSSIRIQQFGEDGDMPLPHAFIY